MPPSTFDGDLKPHGQPSSSPIPSPPNQSQQQQQQQIQEQQQLQQQQPDMPSFISLESGSVSSDASGSGMQMEICRAFLAGRCSRGASCRFVHMDPGMGAGTPGAGLGVVGGMGMGMGMGMGGVGAGHPIAPTPHLCRDWLNGTCQRGATCRFQHHGVSGSKATIHPPHIMHSHHGHAHGHGHHGHHGGHGKHGWGNKQHHVVCHQWASRGRCDYGNACKYAHHRPPTDRWNESALDEKKLLAAVLSGLSPQEALSQALNQLQANNPSKFGPMQQQQQQQQHASSAQSQGISGGGDMGNGGLSPSELANLQNGLAPNGLPLSLLANTDPATLVSSISGLGPGIPRKHADGSMILCRFFARHGYCKFGLACKFYHPLVPPGGGMGAYANGGVGFRAGSPTGGAPQPSHQSLAQLLALGLKASMMNMSATAAATGQQENLFANHAVALLAANGVGPTMGRVNTPPHQQQQQQQLPGQMPPLDPALASLLTTYLQQQQQQHQSQSPQQPMQNANAAQVPLAQLLQQLQTAANNPASTQQPSSMATFPPFQTGPNAALSGQALGGMSMSMGMGMTAPNGSQGDPSSASSAAASALNTDAFQAYLQQQQQQVDPQQQQNAYNTGTTVDSADTTSAVGGNTGSPSNSQLSLPEMINTAFRSTSSNASTSTSGSGAGAVVGSSPGGNVTASSLSASGNVSALEASLSLMTLKPFNDEPSQSGITGSDMNAFNEAPAPFSPSTLLSGGDGEIHPVNASTVGTGSTNAGSPVDNGASGSSAAVVGSPSSFNAPNVNVNVNVNTIGSNLSGSGGSPSPSSLSALFSSSLTPASFLH